LWISEGSKDSGEGGGWDLEGVAEESHALLHNSIKVFSVHGVISTIVELALSLPSGVVGEGVEGSEAGFHDGIRSGSEKRGFVLESRVNGLVESSVVAVSVGCGDEDLAFLELVESSTSISIGKLIDAGVEVLNGKVAGGWLDVGIRQVVGTGFDNSFGKTILVFLVVVGKIEYKYQPELNRGDKRLRGLSFY